MGLINYKKKDDFFIPSFGIFYLVGYKYKMYAAPPRGS